MRVQDHEPAHWFLLADDAGLYLDVHCSYWIVSYSVLIALNEHEVAAYRARGRGYLDELAAAINDSAPAAKDGRSPYRGRDLSRRRGAETTAAVRAWRAASEPGEG